MIKKKPRLRLPGEEFLKHVNYSTPKFNGAYVVYHKLKHPRAWSSTFQIAPMCVLNFRDGKWSQPLNVIGWIGPIPSLSEDELLNRESNIHVYTIGTLEQAAELKWKKGPYTESIHIPFQKGTEGDFGFEFNLKKTMPTPLYEYSKHEQKFIKIKNPTPYIKKIQKLEKGTVFYAITTLQKVKLNKFLKKGGTFVDLMKEQPKKGQYIFKITKDDKIPVYQEVKGNWKQISELKREKIFKMLKN